MRALFLAACLLVGCEGKPSALKPKEASPAGATDVVTPTSKGADEPIQLDVAELAPDHAGKMVAMYGYCFRPDRYEEGQDVELRDVLPGHEVRCTFADPIAAKALMLSMSVYRPGAVLLRGGMQNTVRIVGRCEASGGGKLGLKDCKQWRGKEDNSRWEKILRAKFDALKPDRVFKAPFDWKELEKLDGSRVEIVAEASPHSLSQVLPDNLFIEVKPRRGGSCSIRPELHRAIIHLRERIGKRKVRVRGVFVAAATSFIDCAVIPAD